MRAFQVLITGAVARICGAAVVASQILNAENEGLVEFRYCPPGKDGNELMQACVATSLKLSTAAVSEDFIDTRGGSNTSYGSIICEKISIRSDPVVTILSTLLSYKSSPDEAPIGFDSEVSSSSCGASENPPWTVRVNGSVSAESLIESWAAYANKGGDSGTEVEASEAGALPRIIPKLICQIPIGFAYEPYCTKVLETLWTPLGGLEKIFPFQFSQYCYLCWWIGAVVFDILHWLLHRFHNSKYKVLRKLAWIHMVHHYYFNRSLQFNEKYAWHNTWVELPVEGFCLYIGSLIAWYGCAYFGLTDIPGGFTSDIFRKIAFTQVGKTVYTMYKEGKDANHPIGWKVVPKDPDFLSVGAEYHCLHHIEPDAYYSSIHRFFDHIIGASSTLKGKRVLMTGASGAYGQALIKRLQKEQIRSLETLTYGKDWTHEDFSSAIPKLAKADILILAHGTKGLDAMQANCHSAVSLIELFRAHRKPITSTSVSQMLPEVWYVGSEIEIGSSYGEEEMLRYSDSKRAFARFARAYYDDEDFVYRHIVPAGFTSRMGEGLVSADWAAAVTMFFIKRGSRYTPVTYTLMAYANYFKFLYYTEPQKAERLT